LDRDKPYTGTDVIASGVDGDGRKDVVCGAWWYKADSWQRFAIPNVYQGHLDYDIDKDGKDEYVATRQFPTQAKDWYPKLSGDLLWLDPVDPKNGKWKEYDFGRSPNGWPHGVGIGPVLPKGQLAFFATYHGQGYPLFTVSQDFVNDLTGNKLSAQLIAEFKKNGFALSSQSVIATPRERQ